ncbi:MAG: MFS transporter [Candidatus Bathyarchaeia archaeon]
MSKKLLKGNLGIICLSYFIAGISLGMLRVNIQPFVLSLGASMSIVGVLEAIGGYHGIMATFVQPIAGQASDAKGRKVFLIFGSLCAATAITLNIVASYFKCWMLLILAMFFLGLYIGVSSPARDSIIAESVKAEDLGFAYSMFTFFTLIPGLFAPMIGGYLSYNFGYAFLFYVCLVVQALSLILIFAVKETLYVKKKTEPPRVNPFSSTKDPVANAKLRKLYLIIALDGFSWNVSFAILFGLLSKTYNFSTFQLGIMSSISSFSAICFQLPIGMLIRKFDCKIFMFISEVIGVVLMTGWLMSTTFEVFAALHFLMGIVITTWAPVVKTLVVSSFAGEKAEALGKIAFFSGITSFPAPYIGGFLYDMFGFKAPISVGLAGVVLTSVLIMFWIPGHRLQK